MSFSATISPSEGDVTLQLHRTALPALLVLILALSSLAYANRKADENNIPTQIPGRNAILMGTDWYPEQWPES